MKISIFGYNYDKEVTSLTQKSWPSAEYIDTTLGNFFCVTDVMLDIWRQCIGVDNGERWHHHRSPMQLWCHFRCSYQINEADSVKTLCCENYPHNICHAEKCTKRSSVLLLFLVRFSAWQTLVLYCNKLTMQ